MFIAQRKVGQDARPFVIAEMSGNHNQSLDRALEIVAAAARAGADAIKLQTYTADTMTLDLAAGAFLIDDENSLWAGRTLHDLYREAHTPWAWHEPIMRRARELGVLCFSTPFDETAVDFLEGLDVPAYKIASFEIVHLPLIRRVAATGKPMVISTGMATLAEIDDAVRTAREGGCKDLVLLKCTSTYPATPANSNVLTIPHLRSLFRCEVGLSDHTMGIGAAVAAVHTARPWSRSISPWRGPMAASTAPFRWNPTSCDRWSSKPNAPGNRSVRSHTARWKPKRRRWRSGGRSTLRKTLRRATY